MKGLLFSEIQCYVSLNSGPNPFKARRKDGDDYFGADGMMEAKGQRKVDMVINKTKARTDS